MSRGSIVIAVVFGAIAALTIVSSLVFFLVYTRKENKSAGFEADAYHSRISSAMGLKKDESTWETTDSTRVCALWMTNEVESKLYYLLIRSQAKYSFATAMISGIFGFILFASTIVLSVIFNQNLTIAIIPAISAAVVEIVSAIFLVIHRRSMLQLKEFHTETVNTQKFLSAVLMTDHVEKKHRDALLEEIVLHRIDAKCSSACRKKEVKKEKEETAETAETEETGEAGKPSPSVAQ